MPERVRALDVAELKNFDFWCALRILGKPNLNNDFSRAFGSVSKDSERESLGCNDSGEEFWSVG